MLKKEDLLQIKKEHETVITMGDVVALEEMLDTHIIDELKNGNTLVRFFVPGVKQEFLSKVKSDNIELFNKVLNNVYVIKFTKKNFGPGLYEEMIVDFSSLLKEDEKNGLESQPKVNPDSSKTAHKSGPKTLTESDIENLATEIAKLFY
mgnify:CR=1 FL=1